MSIRLLWFVNKNDRDALLVELGPPRTPHHLEHVRHWEVDVALLLAIVELCALDDDKVCREVDPPCQGRCADEDLSNDTPTTDDESGDESGARGRYRGGWFGV